MKLSELREKLSVQRQPEPNHEQAYLMISEEHYEKLKEATGKMYTAFSAFASVCQEALVEFANSEAGKKLLAMAISSEKSE